MVKTGILDGDWHNALAPTMEYFTIRRRPYMEHLKGAQQFDTAP